MKKMTKWFSKVWFLALMVICLLPCNQVRADESSKPEFPKSITIIYHPNDSLNFDIEGRESTDKIQNLKSANKNIVKVTKVKENSETYICFMPKKVGKTTVSFEIKRGKTVYKFKTVVTVINYQNPCASFKVGSQNLTTKFNKTNSYTVTSKLKGKLSISTKSGWELMQIISYNSKTNSNVKALINKKDITVKKGNTLSAVFYNNKKNLTETINIQVK
jgi:hypothetical protein